MPAKVHIIAFWIITFKPHTQAHFTVEETEARRG